MIMYVHLPSYFESHPDIQEIIITKAALTEHAKTLPKKDVKELAKELASSSKTMKKTDVTWGDFVAIWNAACDRNPEWTRVTERNKDLQKRFRSASNEFTTRQEWELIVKGMELDPFFSGKSGRYERPKAVTVFYNSRYFNFYEAAINPNKKETIDDILGDFKKIMDGINA